jgi:DNA-binding beta-propeller fold protein YncE
VAYVASVKEVWVTTPEDQSLTILDASNAAVLKAKAVLKVGGATEGYAVDEQRGLFFTNLEDKDRTVVVDVRTHRTTSIWSPQCGDAGPRGLALDVARNYLFVACTDHVQVLDGAHDGARLGRLETGAGLDNIDYLASRNLLYAAAGKAARLTVARADDKGQLEIVTSKPTAEGARNAVADTRGNAYLADPSGARLLVFSAAH